MSDGGMGGGLIESGKNLNESGRAMQGMDEQRVGPDMMEEEDDELVQDMANKIKLDGDELNQRLD